MNKETILGLLLGLAVVISITVASMTDEPVKHMSVQVDK
jgi:hypothetical protein